MSLDDLQFIKEETDRGNLFKPIDKYNYLALVKEELSHLTRTVKEKRASGRTSLLMQEIVNNLFDSPLGTLIKIQDHNNSQSSDNMLAKKVELYLKTFCQGLDYRIIKQNNEIFIKRLSKTYQENVLDKIHTLNEYLKIYE